MTTWTYEEVTAHAETEIKRCIELSLAAKERNDIADWQGWRNYAYGAWHLWERTTGGYQEGEKDSDYERLYGLIPEEIPPASSGTDEDVSEADMERLRTRAENVLVAFEKTDPQIQGLLWLALEELRRELAKGKPDLDVES